MHKLLREASDRIYAEIRQEDTFHSTVRSILSRFGGDEFAIILTDIVNSENAGIVANRIIEALSHPFIMGDISAKIGVSIGISCFPETCDTPLTLKKAADVAMYSAKAAGKNTYKFYSKKLIDEYNRAETLKSEINDVIKNGGLFLVYQPIVKADTGVPIGYEVLCRWHHDVLGEIPPEEFISVAENAGLVCELGEWVLKQAIADSVSFIDPVFQGLQMHLNLSPNQLKSDSLCQTLLKLKDDNEELIRRIVFEVTESISMDEPDAQFARTLDALHEMGCLLSIDDFGTGYSSFYRMLNLPIASIKIDKVFLLGALNEKPSKIMLRSIVKLASDLGIYSILEGVEQDRHIELANELGGDYIQGFYISTPLNANDFALYLKNKAASK